MADQGPPGATSAGRRRRRSTPALRQRIFLPERLRALLSQGLDAGFLQLQAPAGCGKTAVVLQFLLEQEIDPRWYTCTRDDADPGTLLSGLVRAIGGAETIGGQTALAAIASRDVPKSYAAALKPFLDEVDAMELERVVVIDDADAVLESGPAAEVLDYALSEFAARMRVVLISRAELPLPSQAKRLLDGRATRIVTDDLLLREEEIVDCARDAYDIDLTPDEAAALYGATSGWGIALRLALRLRDLGAMPPRDDHATFTPEARTDLFAYLAAEVLARVDQRVQAFLRATAVLDTLDPEVCARLTDEERPVDLIQSLAGAGLPVMKAGWSAYRCHSLLREYLLASMTSAELREAHLSAARAYADIGDWAQGLEHFMAAADVRSALALADEHGRDLFYSGHGRALLELVKNAPDDVLREHCRARYWAAFAASRMFQLDWAAAALERVHADATSQGDSTAAQDALRALAHLLNGWGRFPQATAVAQRLLDTVPDSDVAGRAAVTLGYLTTGMGGTGQFREAVGLIRRLLPELSAEPRADAIAEAYARAVAAATLAFEGDFAAARAELNLAQVLILGREDDDVHTFVPWSSALVAFLAADPDAADDAALAAERLALQYGDLQRVLECRAVCASMATMRGDVAAADRGFAELDQLRGGGADHWGVVLTLLSRPHRARLHGDLAGALAAAEANHALAVSTSSAWFVCSTHLDVAYFRLLNGDAEAARAHASTAATEAAELGSSLLRYGSHLMLAATGAADEQESMADALRLSEERDLRFLLPYSVRLPQLDAALWRALDSESGARAAVLLRSTGAASITALRPVAKGLGEQGSLLAVDVLRSFKAEGRSMLRDLASRPNRALATAANDALAALEAANPHGLSEREAEVLSLLSQGLRTKDVAERLVLTPATVSTHIQRIMNKTGTSSRAELLALAARNAGPAV